MLVRMDDDLDEVLHAFVSRRARTIADFIGSDGGSPTSVAATAYGVGMQFALELSQLDPALAHRLITHIHARDHEAAEDENEDPITFMAMMRASDMMRTSS